MCIHLVQQLDGATPDTWLWDMLCWSPEIFILSIFECSHITQLVARTCMCRSCGFAPTASAFLLCAQVLFACCRCSGCDCRVPDSTAIATILLKQLLVFIGIYWEHASQVWSCYHCHCCCCYCCWCCCHCQKRKTYACWTVKPHINKRVKV